MKSEKEKMLSGELYDPSDAELAAERLRCKELCFDFNSLRPSETDARTALLKKIFGSVKDSIYIEPSFQCDYGYNISVGDWFYMNHNCVILDTAKVTFGDNVLVGPNCCFAAAEHPIGREARDSGLESSRPITVGDDVWFGAGVIVLPGVTIGSGAVIGAGSVVNRDIPPNSVAAGNPCRVRKAIKN